MNNLFHKNLSLKVVASSTLWVLLLFLIFQEANGQVKSGYEFHTVPSAIQEYFITSSTPSPATNDSLDVFIYILAYHDACVEIAINGIDFISRHKIAKDSLLTWELPAIPVFNSDTIVDLGIRITSNVPIAVYQGTETKNSLAQLPSIHSSTLVSDSDINAKAIKKSFFGPMGSFIYWAQKYFSTPYHVTTTIHSLEDSNYIEFYHKSLTVDLSLGVNQQIVNQENTYDTVLMNDGEFIILQTVYTQSGGFQNENYAKSINGKRLKITTFSNDNRVTLSTDFDFRSTQNPLNNSAFDYVWEDQKDINLFDTLFYWPKLLGFQGVNISLMAEEDSTEVFVNGNRHLLNHWERMDTSIASSVLLRSNLPIHTYATGWPTYLDGRPITNSNGDQFTTTISSSQELIKKARVPTITADTLIQNVFSLATASVDTNSLLINGTSPLNANWQPFSQDSAWSFINVPVDRGIHLIESSAGFQGYYYSYRPYDSTLIKDQESGSFGHVIPEYSEVPEDSLQLFFGLDPSELWPIDSFKSKPMGLCPGDTLFFNQGAYQNTDWIFTLNGDTLQSRSDNNQIESISIPPLSDGFLTISDKESCFYLDSFRIYTSNLVLPDIESELIQSCANSFLKLWIADTTDADYQWLVLDEKVQNGSSAIYSIDHTSDSLRVNLVINQEGCVDTISKSYLINHQGAATNFIMPNILTPNGDGINDALCFKGLELHTDCFEFNVISRWGNLVYTSSNPKDCWQPQNLNNGTYFYTLKVEGQTKRGFVVINDNRN